MSHIIAYINPLILQNRNFAIQDGSMQLDRTTLDQLDQVYDQDSTPGFHLISQIKFMIMTLTVRG